MNNKEEKEIFLTPSEAMKILKLKRSTFCAYVKQGIIPVVKIGHLLRIRREHVIDLGLGAHKHKLYPRSDEDFCCLE